MQNGLVDFITKGIPGYGGGGGLATKIKAEKFRPEWNKVEKILLNKALYKKCNN